MHFLDFSTRPGLNTAAPVATLRRRLRDAAVVESFWKVTPTQRSTVSLASKWLHARFYWFDALLMSFY